MRKNLIFWPLGPLCLAVTIAGCGQSSSPPETAPAPPAATAVAAPTTAPAATSSAAPNSRMMVSVMEGTLTVSLNDRKVGDYPSTLQLDVTPYLKAGQNTLKVEWPANTRGTTKIEYALAATPDKYNDIATFSLMSPEGKQAGSKSFSFNLPNPDGTLPPVEETATIEPTSAPDTSTSASEAVSNAISKNAASVESATPIETAVPTPATAKTNGVKAIMNVSANDAPISVSLNGQNVGDFQSYLKIDVGRYLKPGKNTLQIKWTEKTFFDVKIAYFSKDANDYRDVSRTRLYTSDTRKPGTRNISFQIPTS